MKKFAFSLERMLGFKRTLYEKERNMLAQMRARRAAVEQRRDNTVSQMMDIDAAFREKATTGASIDDVNLVRYHRENADKLIAQLQKEMAAMDVEIEKQLKVVVALDQDVKGLEKLREKQWEEYSTGAAREEQERISELVSSKFIEAQQAAR